MTSTRGLLLVLALVVIAVAAAVLVPWSGGVHLTPVP